MRSIAISLALLCSSIGQAAVTLSQVNGNWLGSANPTLAVPFLSDNTGGCFLVATALYFPNNTGNITDSNGNNWIRDTVVASGGTGESQWHAANAVAGPNTVTLANTSSAYLNLGIAEFCGYGIQATLDKTSSQTGVANDWNSGSATTIQNGELILGKGTYSAGSDEIHVGAGFTLLFNLDGDIWEYQIQTNAGSINASFSTPADMVTYLAIMATYYNPPAGRHGRGVF